MKYLYTFIFTVLSISCLAQKPMTLKLLESKLDSIISESNKIYNLAYAKIIAEKFIENESKVDYLWMEAFSNNDSIKVKFLNKEKVVIAQIIYFENFQREIYLANLNEKLSNYEDSIFEIKQNFLSQIKFEEYGIESIDSQKVITIIFPDHNKYKIYRILSTLKKNVIPFGNDFLFILDSYGKLTSWKNFHKSYNPMKTMRQGLPVKSIIPKYFDDETYILATDIVLFRIFANPNDMSSFIVNPPKSKRYFTYNSKTNKLRVHSTLLN